MPRACRYDSDDASLIRVARRDFDKAIKVPAEFVARWSALRLRLLRRLDAGAAGQRLRHHASAAASRRSTSAAQYADFFAPYEHIADPLIDGPDEGMTTASVRALFAELRAALVPIVRAITEQPPADDGCLHGAFPEAAQLAFGLAVDPSASATTSSAAGTTRRTIRSAPSSRPATCASPRACATTTSSEALFSTLHEAGHALYEQGVDADARGHAARLRAPRPACTRASRGCGRTWSAAAAASGSTSIPRCARPSRSSSARVPLEHVLPRHQQGRALADPHRRRRGDLQSARHDALRPGARPAGGPARRSRTCRRPGARASRRTSASRRPTTATAACRTCTGTAAASAAPSRATPSATS